MTNITHEQAAIMANSALELISAALKEAGIEHSVSKPKTKMGKYDRGEIICCSVKERKIDTRIEIRGVQTTADWSCKTFNRLMVVLPPEGRRRYQDRAERSSLTKVMADLPKLVENIKKRIANLEGESLSSNEAKDKAQAGMKVLASLAPQYVELFHKIRISVPEQCAGPREPQIKIEMTVAASTLAEILRVLNTAVV